MRRFVSRVAAQVLQIPWPIFMVVKRRKAQWTNLFGTRLRRCLKIHFPACEAYRQRVIQLGEQPDRVFDVGALGVENIGRFH